MDNVKEESEDEKLVDCEERKESNVMRSEHGRGIK